MSMRTVLKDINRIPGVTGSFVLDRAGEMVTAELPSVFSPDMVGMAGRMVVQTALGIETWRRTVTEMNFLFEAGRVIVRGFEGGFICVLAVENVSVPLLNITLNAAVKRASELARHAADSGSAAREAAGKAATAAPTPRTPEPSDESEAERRLLETLGIKQ